jgi:hypothetical protein
MPQKTSGLRLTQIERQNRGPMVRTMPSFKRCPPDSGFPQITTVFEPACHWHPYSTQRHNRSGPWSLLIDTCFQILLSSIAFVMLPFCLTCRLPHQNHHQQPSHPAPHRVNLDATSRRLPLPHSIYCDEGGGTSLPPSPGHTLSVCRFCEEEKTSSSPSSSAIPCMPPPHRFHAQQNRPPLASVACPPELPGVVDGENTGGVDANRVDDLRGSHPTCIGSNLYTDLRIAPDIRPRPKNSEYYPDMYGPFFRALSRTYNNSS